MSEPRKYVSGIEYDDFVGITQESWERAHDGYVERLTPEFQAWLQRRRSAAAAVRRARHNDTAGISEL